MKKTLIMFFALSLCATVNAQQFSRKKALKMAQREGIPTSEQEAFIAREKQKAENNGQRPVTTYHGSYTYLLKQQQLAARTASSSCNNVDLEDGDYNNWSVFKGTNLNSLSTPTDVIVDTTATTTGLNDSVTFNSIVDNLHASDPHGMSVASPYAGTHIARVNHIGNGMNAGILERQIVVSASNPFVNFSYFAFLENAGHTAQEQPYINFIMYDGSNMAIPGASLNIVANSSGANPGFSTTGNYFYKPWTPVSIDLSAYAGQTVTAQFIASDCVQGGHGGYMYIDFECNTAGTTVPETWPGDANYDLTVNFADMFYVGAAYNLTGIPRATVDNSYSAFASTDWSSNSLYLVNAKHADCNGDGTINGLDSVAINLNYGMTHPFKNSTTHLVAQNISSTYPISITSTLDSVYYGQNLALSFNIGNSSMPVDSIYGIGFTLQYPDQLVDPSYTNQSSSASTMGTYGTTLMKLAKPVGNTIDLMAVRTDGQDALAVNGNVFTLHLKGNQQIMNDSVFNFTISNLKAITKTGYALAFANATVPVKFKANLTTGIKNYKEEQVLIYPNPVQSKLSVSAEQKIKGYEISSILGSTILRGVVQESTKTDIDVSSLAKGTYFIHVATDKGMKTVKFVKL